MLSDVRKNFDEKMLTIQQQLVEKLNLTEEYVTKKSKSKNLISNLDSKIDQLNLLQDFYDDDEEEEKANKNINKKKLKMM